METGISSGFLDQKAFPLINAMRSLYCVNHIICIVLWVSCQPMIETIRWKVLWAALNLRWYLMREGANSLPLQAPCYHNPCKNGGKCRPVIEKYDFNCQCTEHFGGKKCDLREYFNLFFSQFVSGRYSTNPAIWLVPITGSILPIRPTHSGRFFSQPFVRFRKKYKCYLLPKVCPYCEKLCPLSCVPPLTYGLGRYPRRRA